MNNNYLIINTNKNPDHKRIALELCDNISRVAPVAVTENINMSKLAAAKIIILPSPSPINLLLLFVCLLLRKKIFVGIHDVVGHEPRDMIKVYVYNLIISWFSSGVIVYSNFSREQMLKKFPSCKYIFTYFLTAGDLGSGAVQEFPHLKGDYLYFGRACEYTGRNSLEYIVKSLPEKYFLLMGRGLPIELNQYPNVVLINRKFTDQELNAALNSCHTVIFPYNSATQSGGIPLAIYHNCNVVYFDVGGLSDQIRLYPSRKIEAGNIDKFITELQNCTAKLNCNYSLQWYKGIHRDNRKTIEDLVYTSQ